MKIRQKFCSLLFGILFIKVAQAQDFKLTENSFGQEGDRKNLLYPFDENDYLSDINVIKTTHRVLLPFRLPFFGFFHTALLVHKDGFLAFNRGLLKYDFPIVFPIRKLDPQREDDPAIIAPWLSLQDIPKNISDAGVYFRMISMRTKPTNTSLHQRIIKDFSEGMIGAGDFTPTFVVIVTWKNMTFADAIPDRSLKTNTYQAVIATDETSTYVMFNYEWISWTTHLDNYEGLKGPQAFVGFNAGNTTKSFELRPYSQQPHIMALPQGGFSNGLLGRYFFQIDEEIYLGSCLEEGMDYNWLRRPLFLSPRSGSIFGGTLVNVTGPCFHQKNRTTQVRFDDYSVDCIIVNQNHATCISPSVMNQGYIDVIAGRDQQRLQHHGRWYITPPHNGDLSIMGDADLQVEPGTIYLAWRTKNFPLYRDTNVTLHLWGLQPLKDGQPLLTHITTLFTDRVTVGSNTILINVTLFKDRNDTSKIKHSFGLISVNISDNSSLTPNVKTSPIMWSRPMPLAWYFKPQFNRTSGFNAWLKDSCHTWYEQEKKKTTFEQTLPRCPCTSQQATVDIGRFMPHPNCNSFDKNCGTFHERAYQCFISGRPSSSGADQVCCYDLRGELVQTADTMYGGRPSRTSVFAKRLNQTVSHWEQDVMPYLTCCKWIPNGEYSDTCYKFKSFRTSDTCQFYHPPGVGSVFGDPHIRTFDQRNYTFNGKGEFALVQSHDKNHSLNIQARFEQLKKKSQFDPEIKGTVLTAIVARNNHSSTVEFRLRPTKASWRSQLYLIVDGEYIYFWDATERTQTFRGLTLHMPLGIWNMSHIIAMFDSGAGIEVKTINGLMSAHIFLPATFMNKTKGLLGAWSGSVENDFVLPNGQIKATPLSDSRKIYEDFANHWRLSELQTNYVNQSLFFHDTFSLDYYDDQKFEPEFGNPPRNPNNRTYPNERDLQETCGISVPCRFDFIVTGNRELARVTNRQETEALLLARRMEEKVVRCPALPRPLYGRKSEVDNNPGSIVHFSCFEGYRLVGTEVRKCQENGLWSWGFDVECIPE